MADNLPKYNSNVGIQVVDQPDPTSATDALINSFKNFSGTFNDINERVTRDEAEEQRTTLKNNISNSYKQFALTAMQNRNQTEALKNYQQTAKEYNEQLLGQTNKFNRGYVQNMVDYYQSEHANAIEKNAILQNKRQQQVTAYEQLNQSVSDWKDAISNSKPMVNDKGEDVQFDAAKALFAQTVKQIDEGARNGNFEERRAEAIAEQKADFTTAMYLKRYEDHVSAGKGDEYLKQVLDPKTKIEGFDPEDKTKLIGKMINIRNQNRSIARSVLGDINGQMHDEFERVADGGTPNQALINNARLIGDETYNKLMDGINTAQHVFAGKQAALQMSPSEIESYKRQLTAIDPNDPDYGHLAHIRDAVIKAIDLQEKNIRSNPLDYALKDKGIAQTINTYKQSADVGAEGYPMPNSPFNSVTPKAWPTIINWQLNKGLTLNGKGDNSVRLLSDGDASDLLNMINSASPQDKIGLMNKIGQDYGSELANNLVTKQLVGKGMSPGLSLLTNIDPNSPDAKDVSEAFSMPLKTITSELKKKDNEAVKTITNRASQDTYGTTRGTGNFESFMNTTARYNADAGDGYYNNISTMVTQLASYYSLTKNMDETSAVSKAEDVIASRYDYTTINNNEVRIPKSANTTEDIVKSFARKIEKEELPKFDFNLKGFDPLYAKELINKGHWQTDNVDNGLVWTDANGRVWTDKNGHPLAFSWKEAKTGVPVHDASVRNLPAPKALNQVDAQTTPDLPAIGNSSVEDVAKSSGFSGALKNADKGSS